MRARVLGALLAVAAMAAVLATAAFAQAPTPTPTPSATPSATPTPTPTVTPTPTPDPQEQKKAKLRKRKVVKRVYRDYRDDGKINNCNHSRKALKRTLQSISDEFDANFPDFREAVKAAIKDWDKKRCEERAAATPTPTPTSTPAPTSTPFQTPVPTVAPPPVATTPPSNGGGHSGGLAPIPSNTPSPPSEGDVAPVQPTATPTPAATAPPPAETELAVGRPRPQNADLTAPLILLGLALLGLAAAGGSAIYARRTGHLAGWGHAWREATYRATGAWGDFSDWLRLGR